LVNEATRMRQQKVWVWCSKAPVTSEFQKPT
jgi:hypothetical protein